MKRTFTLFLFFSLTFSLVAQERYLDEMFSDVEVTTEVYGVNATVLQLPTAGEALPQPLVMDVYQPAGDTMTDRPAVVVLHTGNFLPAGLNQQISGSFRDEVMVDICTDLAKRGYVAVSADYRTGWNPLASTQPLRALGIIQAAYRGVQDGRTAVRFLRALAVDGGNKYNIDPSKISAIGQGTGGYIVLAMTGLDDYNEIVTTTNGQGKFLLDVLDANGAPGMDGVPETPMVVELFHGDVEGKNLTVTPVEGFGLPAGDTTNYSNHVAYADGTIISSDISLGINLGGAIGDISWLADNTIPTISIQSLNDEFAPYNDAVLTVPGSMLNVVQVQGAQSIGQAQLDNGANQVFYNSVFTDATTQLAKDNSAIAGHDYYEGVFPFNLPVNSFGLDEGLGIEWWDPNAPSPDYLGAMGLPWNMLPHPSGAGTFHEVGLIRNEGMSADKARANLATCMDYILPRACVALDLPCRSLFTSSTEELLDDNLVGVTPNPANTEVLIQSTDSPFSEIVLSDLQGRMVRKISNLNTNNYSLDNLAGLSGMHILTIRFEEGMVAKKLIIE